VRRSLPLALLLWALSSSAHAFPGANGMIAFQRSHSQVTRPQQHAGGTDGFVQPSFSPDGTRLVVLAQSGGRLWTVYANGARLERIDGALGPDQAAEHPSFSPDGSRIVFGLLDVAQSGITYRGIHSVRASDGGDLRRLTDGTDFDPVLSPDGRWLAFGRNVSDGGTSAQLMIAGADGSNPQPIYTGASMDEYPSSMAWSPDSTTIVFDKYANGLYAIPAAGGEARTVSPRCADPGTGCGWDSQPVYSPDGTKILFGRQYPGKAGEPNTLTLHAIAADGMGAAAPLFAGTTDSGPTWGGHTTAALPEPEKEPAGGPATTTTTTQPAGGLDARVLTVRGRKALKAFLARGIQVPVGTSSAGTIRIDAFRNGRRVGAGTATAGRAGITALRLKSVSAACRGRRGRVA
jgi:hypothetical protein